MCHRISPDYSANTYLGIHLGTRRIAAVQLDSDLKVLHTTVVRYDVDVPEFCTVNGVNRGHSSSVYHVNPVMWVKALDILLNSLEAQGAKLHTVAAIGGTTQHHGTVYWSELGLRRLCGLNALFRLHEQLTDKCFALPRAPSWMDSSTERQCYRMEQSVGGVLEMSKLTGAKCHPRLAGPQIRKVYETQRTAYNETKRISLVSSFLASLLVGNIASIDYTEASGMNLFDLQSMQWSQQCLDACAPDLRKRLMPPIAANRLQGRIADYYVKRWNFRADCMIVAGMGAHCSAIAGVKLDDNWLVLTLGSYDAISMDFKQRPELHEAHVLCHPTKPHEFVGMLAFRNGSKLREDMCQLLANGDWDRFAQMLRDTPMGNEGHIAAHFPERGYYPFAKGTLRWTSDINQMSQLAMEGVKSFPRPELEARALIEGQMMHYRSVAVMCGFPIGPHSRIVVVSSCRSSHKNEQLYQVAADVFNTPIYQLETGLNASLIGAAYRARYAFYEYREVNCNCRRCLMRRGRRPKLSYGTYFRQRTAGVPKLMATPTPGSDEIYTPLIDRYKSMCRLLAASNPIQDTPVSSISTQ